MKIQIDIDLDAAEFLRQRICLGNLTMSGADLGLFTEEELDLLLGLEALCDEIADQAHDKYGLQTLMCEEE